MAHVGTQRNGAVRLEPAPQNPILVGLSRKTLPEEDLQRIIRSDNPDLRFLELAFQQPGTTADMAKEIVTKTLSSTEDVERRFSILEEAAKSEKVAPDDKVEIWNYIKGVLKSEAGKSVIVRGLSVVVIEALTPNLRRV